jgi:hypothetical protein
LWCVDAELNRAESITIVLCESKFQNTPIVMCWCVIKSMVVFISCFRLWICHDVAVSQIVSMCVGNREKPFVEESFSLTVLICGVLFAIGSVLVVYVIDCFAVPLSIGPRSVGRFFVDLRISYNLKRCTERMGHVHPGSKVDWGALVFVQKSVVRSEIEIRCRDHNLAVIELMLTYYAGDLESLKLVDSLGELLSERRSTLSLLGEIVRSHGAILGRVRSKGKSAPGWVKSGFGKREEELRNDLSSNALEINRITSKLRERISGPRSQEVIQ